MTDATETPRQMGRAYLIGYAAGVRGWATVDDLKLSAVTLPGVADAYQMGVEAGKKDRACIDTFATCPQMPEEGVTAPPVATNNKRAEG